ncbi:protein phosphatase inhibitor 2 [Nematostella vectensis]|uniref:protein phosphatase inhibitor 2 n=1 Tax=Nematostella vectensis TaxID=45351 RepID=UPI00138FA04A|nr:protein phosphatase inhibitor 2 [Nematostella vectensis]
MASPEGSDDDHVKRRGILKDRSQDKHHSGVQWDEMNIMMTYHPEDKDYGHMKINEPPTPYNKLKDPDGEEGGGPSCDPISDDEPESLDPKALSEKMQDQPRRKSWEDTPEEDEEEDDENLTEEERLKKKEFEEHRKYHYNEFAQVKLARKLIEQELKELEDDDDASGTSPDKAMDHS